MKVLFKRLAALNLILSLSAIFLSSCSNLSKSRIDYLLDEKQVYIGQSFSDVIVLYQGDVFEKNGEKLILSYDANLLFKNDKLVEVKKGEKIRGEKSNGKYSSAIRLLFELGKPEYVFWNGKEIIFKNYNLRPAYYLIGTKPIRLHEGESNNHEIYSYDRNDCFKKDSITESKSPYLRWGFTRKINAKVISQNQKGFEENQCNPSILLSMLKINHLKLCENNNLAACSIVRDSFKEGSPEFLLALTKGCVIGKNQYDCEKINEIQASIAAIQDKKQRESELKKCQKNSAFCSKYAKKRFMNNDIEEAYILSEIGCLSNIEESCRIYSMATEKKKVLIEQQRLKQEMIARQIEANNELSKALLEAGKQAGKAISGASDVPRYGSKSISNTKTFDDTKREFCIYDGDGREQSCFRGKNECFNSLRQSRIGTHGNRNDWSCSLK